MKNLSEEGDILAKNTSPHSTENQVSMKTQHDDHHEHDSPPTPEQNMVPSNYKQQLATQVTIKYKECLKNHAASIGGNSIDGCGEFMPSGEQGTIEAFKCSACGCHRNFHRKVQHQSESCLDNQYYCSRSNYHHYPPRPCIGQQYHTSGYDGTLLKLASSEPNPQNMVGAPMTLKSEDHGGMTSAMGRVAQGISKKRFRTKFTQEQKEKMMMFAERADWRIHKLEESVVQQFCQEIGIKRRVLKVWMHNNKHQFIAKERLT